MTASFSQNMKHLSVTHSYYDCSQTQDYLTFNQKIAKEYACYLPFNMIKDINLDLVFYPIFSKVNLDLNFIEFDKSKKIITHINGYSLKQSQEFYDESDDSYDSDDRDLFF